MEKDNTTRVVSLLIQELNIPVTQQSISDESQKHPDFPSLLAISDVLNNWNIPNAPYNLTFEELVDVPVPFIAHFKSEGLVVVTRFNEQKAVASQAQASRTLSGRRH